MMRCVNLSLTVRNGRIAHLVFYSVTNNVTNRTQEHMIHD